LDEYGTEAAPVIVAEEVDEWQQLIAWDFDPLPLENPELLKLSFVVIKNSVSSREGLMSQENETALHRYISAVCAEYQENPYHNFKHAFSVLQGTAAILVAGGGELVQATAVEQMGLLVGALVHDVGHPGYNNDYFVKRKHNLAIRYNDQAVLENMHCALGFELMMKEGNNFTAGWSEESYAVFRRTTVAAILNTDMKVHFDLTSRLQDFKSPDEVDVGNSEQRRFLLSLYVHAADLGNPVLPTKQCQAWAKRVVTEFHRQYERETSEGLVFAPFMACRPDDEKEVAKLQISFINYVVAPMWGAMAAVIPNLKSRVAQLQENLESWQRIRDGDEDEER
jgi:hypothetical protein